VGIEDNRGSGSRGVWTVANLWVHDNYVSYSTNESGVRDNTGTGAVYTTAANNDFNLNTYDVPNPSTDALWFWAGANRTWSGWKSYSQDVGGAVS
jgi:hypothetical protein